MRGFFGGLQSAGAPVEVIVSEVSRHTLRLTIVPAGGAIAQVPVDGALVADAAGKTAGRARRGARVIRAAGCAVRVTDAAIEVARDGDGLLQRITLNAGAPGFSFLMGSGPLLGLGEGGPQFDRRGTVDRGRNGQGGFQLRTHGGRVPIQWMVATADGWGMYIHHPLGAFDFTGQGSDIGKFTPHGEAPPALPVDIFIVASRESQVLMREYARITGFAEMPPLWSLGYMQSHRTLAGPDEIMWVARTFREKKLPCDALIYLGTEFTPSGWNTRNGEFAWHAGNFPEPTKAIDDLHALNYKVVLHIVIEGRRLNGTVGEPCTPENAVPSGRTPDNRWPPDRNVACYWPYHKPLFDLGVDGWWPDQGDGLDAASRLARIRMYWEGSQMYRPDERPFALHRNGYAGMQRYAGFLWSGDVYSTWETLRTHVPVAVNTGLSGIPYWGTDIGGFVPTKEYTGELHVRWFQFGAFCPSFRSHGRTWHLRLPWGWNRGELGPSEIRSYTGGAADPDPVELRNPNVEPIVRKYLELRYRLLPYIYTAVRECHETGLPLMRSMWLHYPDDPEAAKRGDQFLWGRDMLIAPVTEKGATSRRVYLPRGTWFDFWTDERLEGGREIDRPVDLETMPIYVRAGATLPFGPVKEWTTQRVDAPLELMVYPGADGHYTLYEDDGASFEHRRGAFMKTEVSWDDSSRQLSMRLSRGSRSMVPGGGRRIILRVAGTDLVEQVTFTGRAVRVILPR
ncbi:MAG TPA: TIM-barrel domain-containing protein [Vicinamibacterales bacterium]|nr:TIM-barrel domain-containing protein [Vicinamibacterales bacterium]